MATKDTTVQLNVRIRERVKNAVIHFATVHPLQPALGSIVERALVEYLERHDPKAKRPAK